MTIHPVITFDQGSQELVATSKTTGASWCYYFFQAYPELACFSWLRFLSSLPLHRGSRSATSLSTLAILWALSVERSNYHIPFPRKCFLVAASSAYSHVNQSLGQMEESIGDLQRIAKRLVPCIANWSQHCKPYCTHWHIRLTCR
jgi:hypothetical protein